MPKIATECFQKGIRVSAAEAISRHQRRGDCMECGQKVRATAGGIAEEPHFEHFAHNSRCVFSNEELVARSLLLESHARHRNPRN